MRPLIKIRYFYVCFLENKEYNLYATELNTLVEIAELSDEWEHLVQKSEIALPFYTPDWISSWWRHFGRSTYFVKDYLKVFVFRDADGVLIGVAPMVLTIRPGVGPVRTRELQFIGADKNITEIRGPICHPDRIQEVFAALRTHVAQSGCCDWVQWRGLPGGTEAKPQDKALIADNALSNIDFILPLSGCWNSFRSGLPRNIKESLRKCYNSLARDQHHFEIRVLTESADVTPALDRFLILHSARAGQTGTINHPDVFDTPASRAFLRDVCVRMAAHEKLRIFEMVIAGEVVASRIGFLLGDQLYLYYTGYAYAWGRYSVMTTVVAEAIRWAFDAKCSVVNLSTGSDVSKTRWRPQSIVYQGYYEAISAMHGETTLRVVRHLRRRK